MSKFNYDQFKIGDFVEVAKTVVRGKNGTGGRTPKFTDDIPNGEKTLYDGKKTRIGVITGVKYMALGVYECVDDDCWAFCKTGSVTVWVIRFSMAGYQHTVRAEDIKKCDPPSKFMISSQRYSKAHRKILSDYMKNEPRDKAGRWSS